MYTAQCTYVCVMCRLVNNRIYECRLVDRIGRLYIRHGVGVRISIYLFIYRMTYA
jgi:hypothetical protein